MRTVRIGAALLASLVAVPAAATTPVASAAVRPAAAVKPVAVRMSPGGARVVTAVARPRIRQTARAGWAGRPQARRIPAKPSRASLRSRAAAAVRQALGSPGTVTACSGAISPDVVYSCTPTAAGTNIYTFTLGAATDLLLIRTIDSSGNQLTFTLDDPGNNPLSCPQPIFEISISQCVTSQSGTYTLAVQQTGNPFTVSFMGLLSDSTCTAANPSFATPTLHGNIAAASVGACLTLAMTAGQVLHANSASTGDSIQVTVYDSTGTLICFDDFGDCALTGTAPYRVLVDAQFAAAATYFVQLNNITSPQGCLTTPHG